VVGVLGWFVAGAAVAAVLWLALRPTFQASIFARTNYRGVSVPVGTGVVVAFSVVALVAAKSVGDAVHLSRLLHDTDFASVSSFGVGSSEDGASMALSDATALVLSTVVGFALLGLFDDLGAEGDDRGFGGHLRALRAGRLTTGGVKVLLGGALALLLAARVDGQHLWLIPVDGALVALAANVGNLFDRAPGRTIKVALLAGIPLLLLCAGARLHPVAMVLGAAAGLLAFDLREDLMLGDAGSNALGAIVGLGVVMTCPVPVRGVVLVVVLLLNLASEKVSFSKVIDGFGPLRFVDRLGRRRADPPDAAPS